MKLLNKWREKRARQRYSLAVVSGLNWLGEQRLVNDWPHTPLREVMDELYPGGWNQYLTDCGVDIRFIRVG